MMDPPRRNPELPARCPEEGRSVRNMLLVSLAAAAALAAGISAASRPPALRTVSFKKIILADTYVSEGIAVADVNRDGKLDLMTGNLWYEAPAWTRREIALPLKLDASVDKSNSYVNFATDVDQDGWPDQIIIGRPGGGSSWRRNPRGSAAPWTEFPVWPSACNESPHFSDLFGNGKPLLIFAYDNEYMSWFETGSNPTAGFKAHPISQKTETGTYKWSHGLGVGDINGDGRKDVLCKDGYWEAPADRSKTPWPFVRASLGPDCAQMHIYDVNADGLADVVSSSAHAKGVWWYEQKRGTGAPEFIQHTIDSSFSQSHAMQMADLDGDGIMDFITGKRFWAHGPRGDIEPNAPAVLCWYKLTRRAGKVEWTRSLIDSDSGVGVQFEVADLNKDGLLDIAVSNKKGTWLFEQQK